MRPSDSAWKAAPFPVREEVSGTEGPRALRRRGHCPRAAAVLTCLPSAAPSCRSGCCCCHRAGPPPSGLLSRGHGPAAPQGAPFPPGGGPCLPLRPRRRGPGPRGWAATCSSTPTGSPTRTRHRWRRSRAARPARGAAWRPGPRRAIAAPSAPASAQPPAAAEPPRVHSRTSSLHVRRLRQAFKRSSHPVRAPRHAPRRAGRHRLPALPAPLRGAAELAQHVRLRPAGGPALSR